MPELCAVCPSCAAKLKVSNPALAGKRVQCSRCGAPVLLPGLDEGDGQRAVVAGTPATDILKEQSGPRQEQGQRPRPRPPAPAEEERARPRRQRQRRRKGSSSGARLAAYLIGGVVLVMLAGVAAFLLYRMFSGSPAATAPATSHHIGPVARVAPAEAPLPTAPATTPAPASAPTRQASPPPSAAVEAASFGLTSDAHFYTVDTGAGLVFKVRRTRRSKTLNAGDIASLVYQGVEYQKQTIGSHLASGFPASTITGETVGTDVIKITVASDHVTHYYVARKGYPHIYMATYVPVKWGELRWITELIPDLLPNRPAASNNAGAIGNAESRDVFKLPNGETRSKYYGNQRAKDLSIRGVTGDGVGIFMAYGNRETSSGGPFFRDIQNQSAEVYNYMFSGHNQTEPPRLGLHGPYALVFTSGSTPAVPDMSWMDGLGLTGWVSPSRRGNVSGGPITGRDPRYAYTVGFANAEAQYWTDASAQDGSFLATSLKPGTYTLTVYKNELAVHTTTVAVTAGRTTVLDPITITEDPSTVPPLWRIGDWDGTPGEFLNGDKVTFMHPSDVRLRTWDPGVFTVGSSSPATGFPCYQWKDVNGSLTVPFHLTPGQVAARTVRVGITCAYEGARPRIQVNSWTPKKPPAPSAQPESRSLTIGTYRGNNTTFTFTVPASAFVTGTNTLTIVPYSGSDGSGFLSPGYSLDCVDMY